MVSNPPVGTQRIQPYLFYSDAPRAIDFIVEAFGFEERFRMPMPDGSIGHAEVSMDDCIVCLATASSVMGHASPKDLAGVSSSVVVYVDDVDAHHECASSAGATIIAPPEDKFYGDRCYEARDFEGHRWFFATHFKDFDPADAPDGC